MAGHSELTASQERCDILLFFQILKKWLWTPLSWEIMKRQTWLVFLQDPQVFLKGASSKPCLCLYMVTLSITTSHYPILFSIKAIFIFQAWQEHGLLEDS